MQVKIASGSASTGLGIIGTGLAMALPAQTWIGILLIVIGALVFLFDIRFEHGQIESGDHRFGRLLRSNNPRRKMIALIGMIVFGVGFIASAAVYFWPAASSETETSIAFGLRESSTNLGKPRGPVSSTPTAYQAAHERATIIWIQSFAAMAHRRWEGLTNT
jgi:hypothetical protein